MKVPKFYYRPDLNTLESVTEPGPLRPTEPKTDPTAGAAYVPKEQRIFESLKVPGYDTP